ALLNRLSSIRRSRMGSTVNAPRFSWASTMRRFLFCSASCPAVLPWSGRRREIGGKSENDCRVAVERGARGSESEIDLFVTVITSADAEKWHSSGVQWLELRVCANARPNYSYRSRHSVFCRHQRLRC